MKAADHLQLMRWVEVFGATFLLSFLCSLLMLGKFILHYVHKSHIPPAVVGGIIGLICLTVLRTADPSFSDNITAGLETLKRNLVCFVFAALILGLNCSRNNSQFSARGVVTSILHEGMPMVIYNQILIWGQTCTCLFVMCCYKYFDKTLPPLYAAMIPLGLEAGTEISTTRLYRQFWSQTIVEEAESLGLMCAVLMGILLIVYKAYFLTSIGEVSSKGKIVPSQVESFDRHNEVRQSDMLRSLSTSNLDLISSPRAMDMYKDKAKETTYEDASLGVHISLIAISVFMAFMIKLSSKVIEFEYNAEGQMGILGEARLFKISMCCALFCMHFSLRYSSIKFKREWFMRLCGLSLDIIIVAALSKSYPRPHLVTEKTDYAFISMFVVACMVLNLVCFKYIAKEMFPNFWYERGLVLSADALGHSYMGLLVARSLDPAMTTPVPAAYAYKLMILFIPSTGSKNSIVVTLLDSHGEYIALLVSLLVVTAWYMIFLRFFKHRFVPRQAEETPDPDKRIEPPLTSVTASSPMSTPSALDEEQIDHIEMQSLIEFDLHFSEKSLIVTVSQIKELHKFLPASVVNNAWTLRYSLRRDGTSLDSLLNLCVRTDRAGRPIHSSYVILIEDSWGYIFGGYIAHAIENKHRYYGTGDSFVFTVAPVLQAYKWTGVNDMFVVSFNQTIAMGGGGDGFAFQLDSELDTGVSNKSDTFGNECLSSSEFFKCLNVEVWDIGSSRIV